MQAAPIGTVASGLGISTGQCCNHRALRVPVVRQLAVTVSDQTVFVASCKYRKRRTSVSHKGGGRNPKAFAESADLANIELPLACKDFRNYALTANLVQIALLDAVLFYQEL